MKLKLKGKARYKNGLVKRCECGFKARVKDMCLRCYLNDRRKKINP